MSWETFSRFFLGLGDFSRVFFETFSSLFAGFFGVFSRFSNGFFCVFFSVFSRFFFWVILGSEHSFSKGSGSGKAAELEIFFQSILMFFMTRIKFDSFSFFLRRFKSHLKCT